MTGGQALLRRAVAALGVAEGTALLVRPAAVVGAVCGRSKEPPVWVARLLGGRILLQSAAVLMRPSRVPVLAGAAVDALHAASMAGLAVARPAYRRPAVASATQAAAAAVLGALLAGGRGR